MNGRVVVDFVRGACVRDADWWWSRMTQPLAELGVHTVAVALPSCGEMDDTLGDLHDGVLAGSTIAACVCRACTSRPTRVLAFIAMAGSSYAVVAAARGPVARP